MVQPRIVWPTPVHEMPGRLETRCSRAQWCRWLSISETFAGTQRSAGSSGVSKRESSSLSAAQVPPVRVSPVPPQWAIVLPRIRVCAAFVTLTQSSPAPRKSQPSISRPVEPFAMSSDYVDAATVRFSSRRCGTL